MARDDLPRRMLTTSPGRFLRLNTKHTTYYWMADTPERMRAAMVRAVRAVDREGYYGDFDPGEWVRGKLAEEIARRDATEGKEVLKADNAASRRAIKAYERQIADAAEQKALHALAIKGDAAAAYRLLSLRTDNEYERFDIETADDPLKKGETS